jgi:hypothetical protein
VLAFKTLLAGAPGCASAQGSVAAKGLTSGCYTVWSDDGDGVGPSQTPVRAATLEDSLTACNTSTAFAGVSIVSIMTDQSINQSINVTSVAMKFIENSCQPFTENHLLG